MIRYTRRMGWIDCATRKAVTPIIGDRVDILASCNGWKGDLDKRGLRLNWVGCVLEKNDADDSRQREDCGRKLEPGEAFGIAFGKRAK